MHKTLIGKDGYLFLQNDSARELEVHNNNLSLVSNNFYEKYEKIKDKFLLIVFPNKSYLHPEFLPDGYNLKYRPGFDIFKNYFNENILDGYQFLKDIDDVYYKTDTHINNKGSLIIYNEFINKINQLFNLNISTQNYLYNKIEVDNLISLEIGVGDLTWDLNLGDQVLETQKDTYYEIIDNQQLYVKYTFNDMSEIKTLEYIDNTLIDKTSDNVNKSLDWNIISKYILFKQNINCDNKLKVIIFYDSFLCSTLQLYMNLFYEVYFVKTYFDNNIINIVNPDFIFEFRVERFLF
jgi:hypothetical protein